MGAFSRVVMFFSKIRQPHKQVARRELPAYKLTVQYSSHQYIHKVAPLTCCRTLSAKTSCSREISMTLPSICLTSSTSELICSKSCSFSCSNWQNNLEKKICSYNNFSLTFRINFYKQNCSARGKETILATSATKYYMSNQTIAPFSSPQL